jgi:hypothetical protein
MTLDYTKMFLIVTEEAVVKGHFMRRAAAGSSGRLHGTRYIVITAEEAVFCLLFFDDVIG